jgi:WD40 repeat protein
MYLASIEGNSVQLRDGETAAVIRRLGPFPANFFMQEIRALAFSVDNTMLAISYYNYFGGEYITLWDLGSDGRSPETIHTVHPLVKVVSVCFASDKTKLILKYEGSICLMDWSSSVVVWSTPLNHVSATSVVLSPDHRSIISTCLNMLYFWDIQNGEEAGNLVGHRCAIACFAVSNCGLVIATGAVNGVVVLWDAQKLESCGLIEISGKLTFLSFNCSGTRLAANTKNADIAVYDVATCELVNELQRDKHYIDTACFHPTKNILICGYSTAVNPRYRRYVGERLLVIYDLDDMAFIDLDSKYEVLPAYSLPVHQVVLL